VAIANRARGEQAHAKSRENEIARGAKIGAKIKSIVDKKWLK
jgi:hypothetical protein